MHRIMPKCKFDITEDAFNGCLIYYRASLRGICKKCQSNFVNARCEDERSETLEHIINGFKFERVKNSYQVLPEQLVAVINQLPTRTIIVPVSMVATHIRERGYDHAHS